MILTLNFNHCIPIDSKFTELREQNTNNTDLINATYTKLVGDPNYFNFEQMRLYESDVTDITQPSDWDGTNGTPTSVGQKLWMVINKYKIKIY